MTKHLFLLIAFAFSSTIISAQKSDTIIIDANNIKVGQLPMGNHRYLVYFIMGKNATRTFTQFWTRTVEKKLIDSKPVITVNQSWEDKDSIVHGVQSTVDANTFKTLTHSFWWKQRDTISVDLVNNTIARNGIPITAEDTAKRLKTIYTSFSNAVNKYSLNWHLDLEVFSLLPYKKGVTFGVPYYDPGTASPLQTVYYTVTGSRYLIGYNNQKIDCWVLTHATKGNTETFYISKKNKEVLKLEQALPKDNWRYKIKLPFSN
jgi:hypothetical protein